MPSDRYVHPEFGLLSPTARFRRELRMAFFSVLFGIGVGAAAVIALSGNKTSVRSEQPTDALLGNEVKDHTSELDGTKAQVNSDNHKPNAATTCEDNNLSCSTILPDASRPRATRTPAGNDALAIGRAPLGRPDASAGMTSMAPSESSERALEQSTVGRSEEASADHRSSDRLMDKRTHKSARSRPRERAANYRDDRGASRIGGGHDRPGGELDRAYAIDRSYGPKGFWDWSR
jgi:hypothetical protein